MRKLSRCLLTVCHGVNSGWVVRPADLSCRSPYALDTASPSCILQTVPAQCRGVASDYTDLLVLLLVCFLYHAPVLQRASHHPQLRL